SEDSLATNFELVNKVVAGNQVDLWAVLMICGVHGINPQQCPRGSTNSCRSTFFMPKKCRSKKCLSMAGAVDRRLIGTTAFLRTLKRRVRARGLQESAACQNRVLQCGTGRSAPFQSRTPLSLCSQLPHVQKLGHSVSELAYLIEMQIS